MVDSTFVLIFCLKLIVFCLVFCCVLYKICQKRRQNQTATTITEVYTQPQYVQPQHAQPQIALPRIALPRIALPQLSLSPAGYQPSYANHEPGYGASADFAAPPPSYMEATSTKPADFSPARLTSTFPSQACAPPPPSEQHRPLPYNPSCDTYP